MKSDICEVYDDLSVLLKDICQFLNDEVKQLSPKAASRASELINRSKTKLQEISKLLPPDNDSNRYVDMKKSIIEPSDNIPEYFDPDAESKVDEVPEIYSDIEGKECEAGNNLTCPHIMLPAKELPKDKHGYIERKEKFLFIEHYKKLYGGIIDEWLLLYYSEKDNKPFETCNLKHYEARAVEKKEVAFELIPKTINSRTCYFIASTKKDMLQWVSIINRKSNMKYCVPSKPLPKTPNENVAKTKDDLEIYEELTNDADRESQIRPTTLPKSNHQTRKLPASPDENYDFLDSPDEIYDQITGSNFMNNGTMNEYDTEDIYDTISPVSEKEPEEETYDTIQGQHTTNGPEKSTLDRPKMHFNLKSRK